MSRRGFLLRCAWLLLWLSPTVPLPAQEGSAQLKLGLVLSSEERSRLRDDALTIVTEAFVASRRFVLVERSQLDAVFTEKDLQGFLGKGDSDLSDVLGLDLLGIVDVTSEDRHDSETGRYTAYYLKVRLVDVTNGQILTTIDSERSDILLPPKSLRIAGDNLFENVRAAFPPMGFIVKIDDGHLIVDLGEELGVQKGDVLEVVREGEQIIHPVTGVPLPAELTVIGTLKVVATSSYLSTCKLKSGEGEVNLGDQVRFKDKTSVSRIVFGKVRSIFDR